MARQIKHDPAADIAIEAKGLMAGTGSSMAEVKLGVAIRENGGALWATQAMGPGLLDEGSKQQIREAGGLKKFCNKSLSLEFSLDPTGGSRHRVVSRAADPAADIAIEAKGLMAGAGSSMAEVKLGVAIIENGGALSAARVMGPGLLDEGSKQQIREAGGLKKFCNKSLSLEFSLDPTGGSYHQVVFRTAGTQARQAAPSRPQQSAVSTSAQPQCKLIDSKKAAGAAIQSLQESKVVAVDIEGDLRPDGTLSLVQVCGGGGDPVFVFDLLKCPDIMRMGLGKLLQTRKTVKVMHDCRQDVRALRGQFGVFVQKVFDTQAAHMMLSGSPQRVGLNELLQMYSGHENEHKASVQHRQGLWEQRPLPQKLLEYACQDVCYLHETYDTMRAVLEEKGLLDAAIHASLQNANNQHPQLQQPQQQNEQQQQQQQREKKDRKEKKEPPADGDVSIELDPLSVETARLCIPLGHPVDLRIRVINNGTRVLKMGPSKVTCDREGSYTLTHAPPKGTLLRAGDGVEQLTLSLCPVVIGLHRCEVVVRVGRTSLKQRVQVRCGDQQDDDLLKPAGPYVKRRRRVPRNEDPFTHNGTVDPPRPEGTPAKSNNVRPLPDKKIPREWAEIMIAQMAGRVLEELQEQCEGNSTIFADLLEKALFTEEARMHLDVQLYDMVGVCMRPSGRHLELEVPGLAEGRPSVIRGDWVNVTLDGGEKVRYRGRVDGVMQKTVKLAFDRSLHDKVVANKYTRLNVRFSVSRLPLRVAYQGINEVRLNTGSMQFTLFPCADTLVVRSDASVERISKINPLLNELQTQAVEHMLQWDVLFAPYVLWGPPGTGKTTTLVEFVLQAAVLRHKKVLVVAPSNSATDNIAQRLLMSPVELSPKALLRVYAYSRSHSEVPDELKGCCNWTGSEFENPSSAKMASMDIIACTLTKAGTLFNAGVRRGAFDFIVIDEASNATEPEVLGVVGPLADRDTRVILAGDHKQLGPIIHSSEAQPVLGLSMHERLMSREAYSQRADGSFDARLVTELVDSYRSHPEILQLPNEHFYDNRLRAMARPETSHSLVNWEHLPKPGFPLVFEGVDGKDERELNSPSWFNSMEATCVKEWAAKLIASGVDQKDIGVITPYHKQVQKVRMLLKAHDLGGIDVGSTEIFQGQERRVIIISTVRSTEELLDVDARHHLGFVANSRRFNVAVTRAMALLIVVGNPKVLSGDPHWGALLRKIVAGGGYVGMSLTVEEPEEEDFSDARSPSEAASADENESVLSDWDILPDFPNLRIGGPAFLSVAEGR